MAVMINLSEENQRGQQPGVLHMVVNGLNNNLLQQYFSYAVQHTYHSSHQ